MVILLLEQEEDDAFFFERTLRSVAPQARCCHVRSSEDAKCYLKGEGEYRDRKAHPLPAVLVGDFVSPAMANRELVDWSDQHPELARIKLCLPSGGPVKLDAKQRARFKDCIFAKPGNLDEWREI